MKKLLFTFSLLVAMSSFALAQGVVNISGYVTDANGSPMGGYPVEVMSDSLTGINFYTMTYTNNSGYYSATATVGMLSQGGFYVWTQDSCTFNVLSQTVYFNPGNMSISNVDFSICSNGGGGGSSCTSSFTYQTTATGSVTFTGTASGGQAPYAYSWTLGNGMTTNGQTTSATYASGMYLACLTVTDAAGCVSSYCDTVSVNTGGGGSNCAAMFSYQMTPSGTVTLAGVATGGQAPYTYTWSLGNGITAAGQVATALYNIPGVYPVCLTITDATGCTDTYCDSLVIGGGGTGCAATFTSQTTAIGAIGFSSNVSGTTGAVSYFWDFGDGTTSTTANPIHTYSNGGLYLACLTIMDASNCTSTYCDTVSINGGANCSATMSYSTNNTLTANFSVTATGTAPFTYAWDFGDSLGTSTMANPTYTYGASGLYYACVTVTDANGCSVTDCGLITLNIPTSGSLNILVLTDSLLASNPQAVVYLIEHDTVAGTLTAIQTDTTMQGFATFTNLPFGNYLLKAALLSTDPNYSNYLPTYYTQSLTWNGGTDIQLTPNLVGFTYIELIAGTNVGTGPGFIGGLISQGANRGPGDPIEGALVILYDANMNPIGYTYTDANGDYSFDNLPYGVYYVYVEELGLASSPVQVTLSPTTPSMDQVHFDIETSSVRFTSTNEILSVSDLKVYPNPVTDELYMQFELDQTLDADISIVNVTGQVLSNFQRTLNGGNNLIQVQTSELPAGIYTIFLKSEAGIIVQKFIKQ